jgi:dTMP kinase
MSVNSAEPELKRFIVIEGIDGVGKSSVAKALAGRLQGVYCCTPSVTLTEFTRENALSEPISLRSYVDRFAYSAPKTRFLFYLFSVLEASDRIKRLLRSRDVVCDRYIASTIAYHRTLDPALRDIALDWKSILAPDFEFLLEVDNDEHVKRLTCRAARCDGLLEQDISFLRKVKEEFRQLNLEIVDTTDRSVKEVVNSILHRIGHRETYSDREFSSSASSLLGVHCEL